MFPRQKHCYWAGRSATNNPAEGGEGLSMTSTAATSDKATTEAMSVVATATTIADENYARATAINGKAAGPDKVEQAADGPDKVEEGVKRGSAYEIKF